MTKVRLGNLWLAAAVAGVILCAVLMRAFYMPYSGFLRTVLYNILIFSWAVSVWWRILHAQTRRCLLGAAALMLFWLDIRLLGHRSSNASFGKMGKRRNGARGNA